jgi:uncharacterized membrane protein YdjX (TVP38/TMEM64 family)
MIPSVIAVTTTTASASGIADHPVLHVVLVAVVAMTVLAVFLVHRRRQRVDRHVDEYPGSDEHGTRPQGSSEPGGPA